MSEPVASWVYAIAARPATPVSPVTGVAGEPVRLVTHAGLTAVVGSVGPDHGDQERLQRHLTDPEWLERAVRRHHQVVAAVFGATPTVPLRFGTVYHDDRRVCDLLDQRYPQLMETLAQVTGRAEWGVQAFATAGPPAPATGAASHTATSGPSGTPEPNVRPGMAYLMRRRAERDAREQDQRSVAQAASLLRAALAPLAAATRDQPPAQRPDQPGRMVLNAAYLIDNHQQADFTRTVRGWDAADSILRVRVTGPWPAYSFVEIDDEDVPQPAGAAP